MEDRTQQMGQPPAAGGVTQQMNRTGLGGPAMPPGGHHDMDMDY